MDESRPGLIAYHTWPKWDAQCLYCGRTVDEMRAIVAGGEPHAGLCTPEGKAAILAAIKDYGDRVWAEMERETDNG